MSSGFEVAHDLFGQYATDVYTKEAVRVNNLRYFSMMFLLSVLIICSLNHDKFST